MTCPACNGNGIPTVDLNVLACEACGGRFTSAAIPVEQAIKVAAIHLPMVANCGPDGQFYFDLALADGRLAGRRVHGWADRQTGRVTQWG